MDARDDDRLFQDFRSNGDAGALATLFDRRAGELLRLAVHLTGELAGAEDLVQETFLAAIRGAKGYRSGSKFQAWLVGILQNQSKRRRRRWHRRREALLEVELADPTSPEGFESASAAERRAIARATLDRIPEPYRTVLGLRYAHGFSVTEIAEALDRSANTVQSQLQRGTERLRRMLPSEAGLASLAAFSTSGLSAIRSAVVAEASRAIAGGLGTASAVLPLRIAILAVLSLIVVGASMYGVRSWFAGPSAVPEVRSSAGSASTAAIPPSPTSSPDREISPRRPAMDSMSEPSAERIVAIEVVEIGTGRPVPGAKVTGFDRRSEERLERIDPKATRRAFLESASDLERYHASFGTHYESDLDGIARVPESVAWGSMTARKGGLYGERWNSSSTRIEVAPEAELRVRVLDADGNALAGVRLHAGCDLRYPPSPTPSPAYRTLTSDAKGLATLRHVQTLSHALTTEHGLDHVFLVPHVLGVWPEPALRISLDAALPEEVELRLPAAGSVRVRLVDAKGVSLREVARDGVEVTVAIADSSLTEWRSTVVDGVAEFDRVPIGSELLIHASMHGYQTAEIRHPGLRRHGESLEIALPLGIDATVIRGRIVDDRGEPLRDTLWSARTRCLDGIDAQQVDTDRDGNFLLLVSPPQEAGNLEIVLHAIELRGHGPRADDHRTLPTMARLPLVAALAGVTHEVGDVVARTRAPILSGRWQVEPESLAYRVPWMQPRLKGRGTSSPEWTEVFGAAFVWNDDGSFAVYGETDFAMLRIDGLSILGDIGTAPLIAAPLEAAPGTHDHRIDLVAGGAIVLDFLGPSESLRVELSPRPGVWPTHDERPLLNRKVDSGLIVVSPHAPNHTAGVLQPIWPGRYRLTLRVEGDEQPLRVVEDLVVSPNARARPFIDEPLGIRPGIEFLDLQFGDADGDRLRDASVWLRDETTGRVERLALDDRARLLRVVSTQRWRAVVTAPHSGWLLFGSETTGVLTLPKAGVVRCSNGADPAIAVRDWPDLEELGALVR